MLAGVTRLPPHSRAKPIHRDRATLRNVTNKHMHKLFLQNVNSKISGGMNLYFQHTRWKIFANSMIFFFFFAFRLIRIYNNLPHPAFEQLRWNQNSADLTYSTSTSPNCAAYSLLLNVQRNQPMIWSFESLRTSIAMLLSSSAKVDPSLHGDKYNGIFNLQRRRGANFSRQNYNWSLLRLMLY